MTAVYDKLGLRFFYAEGWKITEDEMSTEPRIVSLESPGGSTWELMLYSNERDLDDLANEAVEVLREEYDELEVSRYSTMIGDVDVTGHEIYFYHLDLVVHTRVLAAHFAGQTALLLWQAEDRDFDALEPVFLAMTTSLLNPHKFPPTT